MLISKITHVIVLIAEKFRGCEQLMIIGDTFVRKSAKQHLINSRREDLTCLKQFEVNVATGDTYDRNNPYFTGRICNSLIKLINNSINMPKLVVLIVENDIINEVKCDGIGSSEHYIAYIENIIKDFKRVIEQFREILPISGQRNTWPKLLFLPATLHRNYSFNKYRERKVFNEVLSTISDHHKDTVWALKLMQVWNENDLSLYSKTEQRYTKEGLDTFWRAVDRTIAFGNRKLNRETNRPPPKMSNMTEGEESANEQNSTLKPKPVLNDKNYQNRRDKRIFWNRGGDSTDQKGGSRRRLPPPY